MNADCNLQLQRRIEQLEAKLLKTQKRLETQQRRNAKQRQKLEQKYGAELLALIDGDLKVKIEITELVEKIVFKDEWSNVISETDEFPVGRILELKWIDSPLHSSEWSDD